MAKTNNSDSAYPEIEMTFEMEVSYGAGDRLPDYEGEYTVTPSVDDLVLPTKDTSMLDDLTIAKIPLQEVGNIGGGTTVIIGI